VLKKPELTAYFMNSLKDPIWFGDLEAKGFFDVRHSPEVKVIQENNQTIHQAEGWPALRYLQHIAPLVDNDKAQNIASIIRLVSTDAQQRNLDNWRTWWSLATIISHLPLNVIAHSDIEMARNWLLGRFDANMVGHELGERLLPRLLDSADPSDWQKALALVDALSTLCTME
jgi:hypothetical protein